MIEIEKEMTLGLMYNETNATTIRAFLRREISRGISHFMRFAGSDPSLKKVPIALSFPVGVADEL
ncbi:hypothetical protein [Exiguobacterium acetylicum]|uniref:hypothetical protein n=1 Tax=Exiguobacterium acetylicum TaxID=41170 RepID=UPI001EE37632|nr:hypothetical protein [Exiguobacterium acetylicum]UKS55653.1 hypothetical protein K6T22_14085 [Exiguobacterium acetylicum]